MAAINFKVSNRSRKGGIKNLPPTVELPSDATVEDAKIAIARATRISDYNRVGIFDPLSQKTLKDRKSLLRDHPEVIKRGQLLVKDLGAQLGWRTVYIIEYIGPLVFHPLFLGLRDHIYPAVYPYIKDYVPEPNPGNALSLTQKTTFALVMAHFVKRELETIFLHKFSANTMPARNIFKNSAFYWLMAGLLGAVEIYAPFSPAAKAETLYIDYLGIALFLSGEIANLRTHYILANLRKPGETARKIPKGLGFNLVTCPNYMFEILAWVGIILVSRSSALATFIAVGAAQMYEWAWGKEKAYRQQFPDQYKKKRSVLLPGLL
ncbi:3-oxo-5-alpha-steroid 4-dehydrogenase-domain-containing protein [Xylariomycetidae sp. FL2044]|nr:3-oxo-5-alpha-steroid 4-dehydrogenase-domain-containing protein [Xylariomycetidae sp. FL2044]